MRRYLRISLRFALLLMVVFGCLTGYCYRVYIQPIYEEERAVAALSAIGNAKFEFEEADVPAWVRWVVGPERCKTAKTVYLVGKEFTDDSSLHLKAFHNLTHLHLWWVDYSIEGLRNIPTNDRMYGFTIRMVPLSLECIDEVVRIGPNVEFLLLEHTKTNDDAVEIIASNLPLTFLSLQAQPITDDCLTSIEKLTRLKYLGLAECNAVSRRVLRLAERLPVLTGIEVDPASISHKDRLELEVIVRSRI